MSRLSRWLRNLGGDAGKYWPRNGKRRPVVAFESDSDFHRRYDEAMAATGMKNAGARRMKRYVLDKAIERIHQVPGDICEVGCFRGMSAYMIAERMASAGRRVTIHLCDSFEGLSKPTEKDVEGLPSQYSVHANSFFCSEEQVRKNLARFDVFEFHKGWVPNSFSSLKDNTFRFVHIDVDLYEPTLQSIEFLWPRLSPRGLMLLDDYGANSFPGAKRAADEHFKDRHDCFLMEHVSGQAVVFKLPE
jgi:predicted O-methyltransferase YrrM